MKNIISLFLILFLHTNGQAATWSSLTWDNDVFVGKDHGYTNGIYVSRYSVGPYPNELSTPQPGPLARSIQWWLPQQKPLFSVNAYTLGQIMITPRDITKTVPDPNDLPYSGTLFLTNTYISAQENVADKISVTIGVVGPASGAEGTQKLIHELTLSTPPKGWSSQLENEFVFQLERARIWRQWLNNNKRFDSVYTLEASAGMIKVATTASALLRWGSQLQTTYITPALTSTRTSNPVAVDGGWFIFGGFKASYIASQVYIDGNTFRDSVSTELDHTQIGASIGATYSWKRLSISLAMEQLHLFEHELDGTSEYGTLTFAWKQ